MPTIHPRADWEHPAQPITGPAPRGEPHTWVIHYPGGPDGSFAPMTDADVIATLRATQADYLASRGYSIGYGYAVSQSGSTWEVRGRDFNNAANAGKKLAGNFNNISVSIQVMVSGQDPARLLACHAVNAIIATEPDWNVIVHSDVDWTVCAGAGLTEQVANGTIGQHDTIHPPLPPSETDMIYTIWQHPDYANQWLIGAGAAFHLSPALGRRYAALPDVEHVTEAHQQTLDTCLFQCGLTVADLLHL